MNAYKTEFLSLLDDAICAFKQEQLASPFCFGNNEDINFFNLKTAVGPCKKVQDFAPEPLDAGVEHSQKVKATTESRGSGSKDCAFLPAQTAVFRLTNPNENVNKGLQKEKDPLPGNDADLQIREILKKTAPNLRLCTHVPGDAQAKAISETWKEQFYLTEVAVLALGETGPQLQFLQNLSKAVDVNLRSSKVIDGVRLEKEKKWEIFLTQDSLKWVFCSPQIYQFPELMRFFKELPATKERFLNKKNLLLLNPIASYISNPALKTSLW